MPLLYSLRRLIALWRVSEAALRVETKYFLESLPQNPVFLPYILLLLLLGAVYSSTWVEIVAQAMGTPNLEADKMLDVYIYDYLVKRKMNLSARAFCAEAEVPADRKAFDTPGGFLFEWWSIFWDIFIARYRCPASGSSSSPNEIVMLKLQEQQQQQQHHGVGQQQQLQQLLLQKHIEQQTQRQREETRYECGADNETQSRQSRGAVNAQTNSKSSLLGPNRKPMQCRTGSNARQPLDQSYTAMLTSGTHGDQHPRRANSGGNQRCFSGMKDQPKQPHISHGPNNTLNPLTCLKSAVSDDSLTQLYGSNHGVGTLPLKGWSLMGFEQHQSGLSQLRSPLVHPSQPSQQLQLQQQIHRLLGDQYMNVRKDTQPHFLTDMVPNALPVQAGLPLFSGADETLVKLYQLELAKANRSQQQYQRPTALRQCTDISRYKFAQQENAIVATSNSAIEATFSNTSRDNDQNPRLRKRKLPMSPNPTSSSGTANTIGPSQSSSPSSPSTTQPTEDGASVPSLLPDSKSQKFCSSVRAETHASVSNQMADIVRLMSHGSVDDNVDSFLDENVGGSEDVSAQCMGITFSKVGSIEPNAVNCFDFSYEGELIATGGDDNKVVLWCTDSKEQKFILEEHSNKITDVRFSPRLPLLASCSVDRMIKIWDVHNPGQSIRTFTGHSASVISVDFNPKDDNLICSCDDASAIRYWNIKDGSCAGISKAVAAQVRYQPAHGIFLAAAVGDGVSLIDCETNQTCRYPLKGHASKVHCVCWSSSGDYLASLSEDLVRVWKIGSGGDPKCIHELSITGKRFRTCNFHPTHPSFLIVGTHQSLEFWNMAENKTMAVLEEPISVLASSTITGLVASSSWGKTVKLWK
ncbi:hypothetical protein DM860_004176 [Cuscuta australis]|uniref:LisH domain-containing protein n=1 Tax=Cuscuta australis TaxID=267555 RepID=A0A328CVV2_9ASTE|nr:hypothetical protein DM860_004176 [Cuscuta australis]